MTSVTQQFREARDKLQSLQFDYETAYETFEWPRFDEFNFAIDWVDQIGSDPASKDREALVITEIDGTETRRTYEDLARRSSDRKSVV